MIHPVVIFYKENEKLKHFSHCVISGEMEHDVAMVYQEQNEVLKKVLVDLPYYFSDGCASQYKNHGKQPCDGIRSTVKRLTRLANLGRATGEQILTPTAMFNFSKDNIEGINFMCLPKDGVDATKAKFTETFDNIKTIPGTKSFHKSIPITPNKIGVTFCCEDQDICQTHNFGNEAFVPEYLNLKNLEHVCCTYSKNLWIGLITGTDIEEKVAKIKFLHTSLPSVYFVWPKRDELCWVLFSNICSKINVPLAASLDGTYTNLYIKNKVNLTLLTNK